MKTDWFEVLLNILTCFGQMEGTWYEGDWESFGVTPEQRAEIAEAWDRKHGIVKPL